MHKSLTLETAAVILPRVICCLDICLDDLSHSFGRDHDVYFLPSTVTDVILTAITVLIKIKIIPSFLVHNKLIEFLFSHSY
jgi:hypothetical protein